MKGREKEILNITKNGVMHKVLCLLCKENMTTRLVRSRGGIALHEAAFRADVMDVLCRYGYISHVPDSHDSWAITPKGVEARQELGFVKGLDVPDIKPSVRWGERITNVNMRTPYDGAELKATVARPGAYDAFALPSLTMESRRWRNQRGDWGDRPLTP